MNFYLLILHCLHSSLTGWMKSSSGELASTDAVRGVPEGVQEQLEQLKV